MTTQELINDINLSEFMGKIPTTGAGTGIDLYKTELRFISKTLQEAGMDHGILKWIPYELDYQGALYFLKTDYFNDKEPYLQEICDNVLGYGDCSYTLIKLFTGHYIIDMCT